MQEIAVTIQQVSDSLGINPRLIAAIIYRESGGYRWAFRHEPVYFENHIKSKRPIDLPGHFPRAEVCDMLSEGFLRASSFGLMQILGETAREHGYEEDSLAGLFDVSDNITLGSKIFVHFLQKEGDLDRALLRYNGGGDPEYPAKVLKLIDGAAIDFLLRT